MEPIYKYRPMNITTIEVKVAIAHFYLQYNRDAQKRASDDKQHWLNTEVSQVAEQFQITIKVLVFVTITGFIVSDKYESGCCHFCHDDQNKCCDALEHRKRKICQDLKNKKTVNKNPT